jgi:putative hydrolase of the HAD superfamily
MKALLFDIGGVLLTNGWDADARKRAAEHFAFDWQEFQARHDAVVSDLETGRITLQEYLAAAVFSEPRAFSPDAFRKFMQEQSHPDSEALAFVAELARSRTYFLATLNNESKELNEYRIARFRLRDYFDVFFSSCYLGIMKPDESIFRRVLELTQRSPSDCVFVDDREANVAAARRVGMHAIRYVDVAQLRAELPDSTKDRAG